MSLAAHPAAPFAAYRSSQGPRILDPPPWSNAASVPQHGRSRAGLDAIIPPQLHPLVRAYLLGYASSVAPRLLTVFLTYFTAHRRRRRGLPPVQSEKASFAYLRDSVRHILGAGLEWRRFPAFCATLVGGSTLLEVPFCKLLARSAPGLSIAARTRLSRWLASFVAAYGGLRLLQLGQRPGLTRTVVVNSDVTSTAQSDKADGTKTTATAGAATPATPSTNATIPYAGRTLDLTLFAVTRAVDVIVGELWARHKARRVAAGSWSSLEVLIGRLVDPAIFSMSSGLVMWAWFYAPSRLPHAYNKWITSAAAVDARLINALRLCRNNQLQYGKDLGPDARVLEGMSQDYGWPLSWGDPAVTVPFPCTMVHMDCGPSCEYHALMRMWRSWRWSMATYLPLSLLLVLRKPNRNPRGVLKAILSAIRSSAFLGTFITLFFYGVCLARTRVGPLILGTSVAARQTIDSGLCTAVGCGLCGWSILIERASRRKDIGLFVVPRALATMLPRRYPLDKQWRETLVFAASTAVVFTAIQENPKRVRGVMGEVLKTVLVP
ncbi:uncharacterized protein SPSK_00254 [Sporothrix schenckii 1099-18]|uniref:Integral membrane protein n=1 Tax=Sporothrix schenckii 1099-18 TaxID=1397361 RepID=A0A0F2M537_SPOSC|nr:uncharacterized protein SPSK_00254 [Sporothrix schenckii 1099-18]KJR83915.1 integral membrane protein [Sporothrix schenckii 1099-18]